MREQIIKITSDLTGNVHEGPDVPTVKITINGKSGTLDVTGPEADALAAFLSADEESRPAARDALRALLAPAPAPAPAAKPGRKSPARSSGSKGADPRNTVIREWAGTPEGRKEIGIGPDVVISVRGRLPKEYAQAYDRTHPVAA